MPGLKAMRRERNRLLVLRKLGEGPATDHDLMRVIGYQVTSAVAKQNLRALMSDIGGDTVTAIGIKRTKRGCVQHTWSLAPGLCLCAQCRGRGVCSE